MLRRKTEPTEPDLIREAEEAIARARADRDRIEAEAEEIRERLGRVGDARALALLGDGDAEQVAAQARERRERLAEIEAETEDLTAAIGTLSLRVVGLQARAVATERSRADIETAHRRVDLDAAAAAYRAAAERHRVAEAASEEAERNDLHASLAVTAVERLIAGGSRQAYEDDRLVSVPVSPSRDPLVDLARERAQRDRINAQDHEAQIRAAIRNPGLLLQTPHLRAEVERRRPEFAAAEARKRALGDANAERLGLAHRREG